MREIITWLRSLEELACNLYAESAEHFSDDTDLCAFLARLADDESWHFHLMGSAAQLIDELRDVPSPAVAIDDGIRERIECAPRACYAQLKRGELTAADMIEYTARIEFSEWNDLFVYVIRICQNHSRAFQHIAATVQEHKNRVETFLAGLPEDIAPLGHLSDLPAVWEPRYLVVEDDDLIRKLYEQLLSREGTVVSARNGKEALDQVQEGFFNVILSDLDMPVMNGTEFFMQASALERDFEKRFILCTGNTASEVETFCREQGIRCLHKPVQITELLETVRSLAETSV